MRGKKNLHDADRQQPDVALKTGRDEIDDPRRDEDADRHDGHDDHAEERQDHAGDAPRHLVVILGDQSRVDGDERRGEHAFAEKVLQEVRDLEAGVERARRRRVAEVVGEDAHANRGRRCG